MGQEDNGNSASGCLKNALIAVLVIGGLLAFTWILVYVR